MSRIGEDPTRFGLQPRPEAASSQTSGPKTTLRAPDGFETQQPRSPGKLHLKFLRHRTRADCSYPTTPKSSQTMCSLFFALRGQLFSPLISPGGGIGDLKENRPAFLSYPQPSVGGLSPVFAALAQTVTQSSIRGESLQIRVTQAAVSAHKVIYRPGWKIWEPSRTFAISPSAPQCTSRTCLRSLPEPKGYQNGSDIKILAEFRLRARSDTLWAQSLRCDRRVQTSGDFR